MTKTMSTILGLAIMLFGFLGVIGLMPIFASLCENWRSRSWWAGLFRRNSCPKG